MDRRIELILEGGAVRLFGRGSVDRAGQETQEALDYCLYVYESTIGWYKVADAKGQLLLTLNGVLITVLTGAVLIDPDGLAELKQDIQFVTWLLLLAAAVAIATSIVCAIGCLHSRLSDAHLDKIRDQFAFIDSHGRQTYRPAATFWFGTIARLPADDASRMVSGASKRFALAALSDEIPDLAHNVLRKHQWVNAGWTACGVALMFLLLGCLGIVLSVT